jgi:SAM-dependent methyltransferase
VARELYDRIGVTYTATRTTDPRLAAAIWEGLGDAATVINVGAGAGAYEPPNREVTAVEPSATMIAQRPRGAAAVVQADAAALPFADGSFDAAMAVLSDHHWRDRAAGLRELRRVARRRVVLFQADPAEYLRLWLSRDYLPVFEELVPPAFLEPGAWEASLTEALGQVQLRPVPIPHDCVDGFYGAFWRRPEAYLDPAVRAGISVFARLPEERVTAGLAALARDLASGAWARRNGALLTRASLHLGYYVVVAELG